MRTKFTTTIDDELLTAIKAQAAKEKRPVNRIIDQCLELYLQYVSSKPAV